MTAAMLLNSSAPPRASKRGFSICAMGSNSTDLSFSRIAQDFPEHWLTGPVRGLLMGHHIEKVY